MTTAKSNMQKCEKVYIANKTGFIQMSPIVQLYS